MKYLSADEDVRAIADLRQKDLNDRISEKNAAIAKEREKAKKREKELIKKAEKREQELKSKAEKREQELKAKAEKEKAELKAKSDAEKRESVRNLLSAGISAEVIAKSLNLSLDEVNEIKKKVQ